MLSQGLGDAEHLAEIGRLGARLVLQKALEEVANFLGRARYERTALEEVANFLGRARYERTAQARGSRNGVRPRRGQTAEGELSSRCRSSATPSSSS